MMKKFILTILFSILAFIAAAKPVDTIIWTGYNSGDHLNGNWSITGANTEWTILGNADWSGSPLSLKSNPAGWAAALYTATNYNLPYIRISGRGGRDRATILFDATSIVSGLTLGWQYIPTSHSSLIFMNMTAVSGAGQIISIDTQSYTPANSTDFQWQVDYNSATGLITTQIEGNVVNNIGCGVCGAYTSGYVGRQNFASTDWTGPINIDDGTPTDTPTNTYTPTNTPTYTPTPWPTPNSNLPVIQLIRGAQTKDWNLYYANPADGTILSARVLHAPSGDVLNFNGLARRPTTGVLYVVYELQPMGSNTRYLAAVNENTGNLTIVHSVGNVGSLAFDAAGNGWATQKASGPNTPITLHEYNVDSWSDTNRGDITPTDYSQDQSLAYNPNDGKLYFGYGVVTGAKGSLMSIELVGYTTTELGVIKGVVLSDLAEPGCLAWNTVARKFLMTDIVHSPQGYYNFSSDAQSSTYLGQVVGFDQFKGMVYNPAPTATPEPASKLELDLEPVFAQ